MGWTVAYWLLCIINSTVLTISGLGADTWQWWTIVLIQAVSFICGRAIEDWRRG